ncbi:hypothetical protein ACIQGT_41050 [Streptomyces sp. NPDC093108]|jgi:hypothetical protein|uniref:hypothetical protein n=1 Tax=unclassified Streptomyces TaxID=2593676 RepID=UPI00381A4857
MEMVAGAGGWWNPPADVVTRTVLPGRREWVVETGVPALPSGYVAAESERAEQGGDEIRIKHLMIAAISRWGYGR